jgi:hypothetical protein
MANVWRRQKWRETSLHHTYGAVEDGAWVEVVDEYEYEYEG